MVVNRNARFVFLDFEICLDPVFVNESTIPQNPDNTCPPLLPPKKVKVESVFLHRLSRVE